MNITLNTDATRALDTLTAELDHLEAQRSHVEDSALAGALDATDLANFNARAELLRTRRAAAERNAHAERTGLGSEREIATAVAAWKADPALNVDELNRALDTIGAAIAAFKGAAAERNAAIKAWARKFDELGVPAVGLEIDGEPVSIHETGGEARISIGGATVQTTNTPSSYVAGVLDIKTRDARPLNTESLAADDRRGATTEHLEVQLLKALGGLPRGTTLSTRTGRSRSALARLVHTGQAEVTSGKLPEPSLTERILQASAAAEESRVIEAATVLL